ncbi:MAG: hypothetical protein Q9187_007674 [Circinaria calcarea]
MTTSSPPLASQICAQLKSTKSLVPSRHWLNTFIANQRPTTPLNALVQTASFRLLNSDITTCLDPTPVACFPLDIQNADIQERRVPGPMVAQVLNVEDMSKSRWQQIEAIEALERGEGTKGREIVRVVPTEDGDDPSQVSNMSGGPHKLLLQDSRGARAYGIELRNVAGISLSMSIGSKISLKNVVVARGVVLLEPATTSLLGGKIDALHKNWKENRKADLRAAIETGEQDSRQAARS